MIALKSLKSLLAAGAAVLVMAVAGAGVQAATVAAGGTAVGGPFTIVDPAGATIVARSNTNYDNDPTTPASNWIWRDGPQNPAAFTPITFRFTFDLTGFVTSSASLSGVWGVDNAGEVQLNGNVISSLPTLLTSNFNVLTAFSTATGFVSGLNTLDFIVANLPVVGLTNNPAAFRAAVTVTATPVPVPAAGGLLLLALGGLGIAARRRRG